jgi:UDP-N-acetylglucosamine 2-epimerase
LNFESFPSQEKAELMLGRNINWINPFGDGKAGMKIVQILRNELNELGEDW